MPGTRPGMTSFAIEPYFIGGIFGQALRMTAVVYGHQQSWDTNSMLMNGGAEKLDLILRCLSPLGGEPRRIGHKRPGPSFETPRKRGAPRDDG
jgi:hypothetical protein